MSHVQLAKEIVQILFSSHTVEGIFNGALNYDNLAKTIEIFYRDFFKRFPIEKNNIKSRGIGQFIGRIGGGKILTKILASKIASMGTLDIKLKKLVSNKIGGILGKLSTVYLMEGVFLGLYTQPDS